MNIKNKVFIAIGLVLPVTAIYYYAYVSADKIFMKWCKTNYCFEFPPYADVLAIYVAVVGLVFVIESLDAWKKQDKYNNAKARVAELNSLQPKITLGFSPKICRFYDIKQKATEKKILRFDYERDYVVACFEAYLDDTQILDNIRKLERENYYVKNCLYQNDFDKVIEHAHKYVAGCVNEIRKLEITEDDSAESYQNVLTQVYKRHQNYEHYFKTELVELNRKLNEFIE